MTPVPEHYHSMMRNQTLSESTCSPHKPPAQPLNNVLNNMTPLAKEKRDQRELIGLLNVAEML
ncbi:hypothetical protein Ocin01_17519 [Orchesella cincta]|uniref:Uncharacterized protein n=1 Tax=Orchesella cincta TaxID=48709 RepID=A0A1D2M8D6_ORCCI|nr:hypothetical protein Ocin01_17519 [Orchesella cincta]